MNTPDVIEQSQDANAGGVQRVGSEQTFADQIRLAGKARKYSKRQLVAELLESDRMLRADAAQIQWLGNEVARLKELLANGEAQ
jgi:hypothetical protein